MDAFEPPEKDYIVHFWLNMLKSNKFNLTYSVFLSKVLKLVFVTRWDFISSIFANMAVKPLQIHQGTLSNRAKFLVLTLVSDPRGLLLIPFVVFVTNFSMIREDGIIPP